MPVSRTDRTTIWYLVPALTVGGTERTLVDLVNNLDRDRFDVTVWTITDEMPLADEIRDDVPVETLDADGKFDVTAPFRLTAHVARSRPDILQSFLFFDNVLARLVGTVVPGVTVVSGVRSVAADYSTLRAMVDRATIPLADLVVSNSVAGATHVRSLGVDPERIRVVPNGRANEPFSAATEPPGFRERLDVPTDATVVGSVGRLVESKGFQDLLDAWNGIVDRETEPHLVLVGDGPYRDELERRTAHLGLSDSVTFTGFRDDVPRLLAAFDVFAFPTHYEGFSGALLEAMAAGLPIVATPVGGNTEMIVDGETGLLTPSHDPAALETRLRTLLDDLERARALGQRAQRVAAHQFSLTAMTDRFERLYEEIEA